MRRSNSAASFLMCLVSLWSPPSDTQYVSGDASSKGCALRCLCSLGNLHLFLGLVFRSCAIVSCFLFLSVFTSLSLAWLFHSLSVSSQRLILLPHRSHSLFLSLSFALSRSQLVYCAFPFLPAHNPCLLLSLSQFVFRALSSSACP